MTRRINAEEIVNNTSIDVKFDNGDLSLVYIKDDNSTNNIYAIGIKGLLFDNAIRDGYIQKNKCSNSKITSHLYSDTKQAINSYFRDKTIYLINSGIGKVVSYLYTLNTMSVSETVINTFYKNISADVNTCVDEFSVLLTEIACNVLSGESVKFNSNVSCITLIANKISHSFINNFQMMTTQNNLIHRYTMHREKSSDTIVFSFADKLNKFIWNVLNSAIIEFINIGGDKYFNVSF